MGIGLSGNRPSGRAEVLGLSGNRPKWESAQVGIGRVVVQWPSAVPHLRARKQRCCSWWAPSCVLACCILQIICCKLRAATGMSPGAAPRGDHFVARRVGVQQMVRADRADLVLPRRQRVPLQQHTIALQHAATTRRRHACRVPHAARDSTATRRVTSSVRNARVHARACLATRERARAARACACASVGAGGWLPCPWAAARRAAATAARRRTASCLRRAVCPL